MEKRTEIPWIEQREFLYGRSRRNRDLTKKKKEEEKKRGREIERSIWYKERKISIRCKFTKKKRRQREREERISKFTEKKREKKRKREGIV